MPLPIDFQFSQASLQDYVNCPRRFQLRYLEQVAWPAIQAEPVLEHEQQLQRGSTFHHMVHQHILGMPVQQLSEMVTDEALRRWWRNYLESGPTDLPATRHPEIVLSAPLGSHRVTARYDLIAVEPGWRAVIVDWKTGKRKAREKPLERLQTRVYPFVLVEAGRQLNGGAAFSPEQIEMRYWFADHPGDPECMGYDNAAYQADGRYLAALAQEIESLGDETLPLTDQEKHCRNCRYRSLCDRGISAGPLDDTEDAGETTDEADLMDFGQIAEIAY